MKLEKLEATQVKILGKFSLVFVYIILGEVCMYVGILTLCLYTSGTMELQNYTVTVAREMRSEKLHVNLYRCIQLH